MMTKQLTADVLVDMSRSRCVWDNGRTGDARVELWADAGNEHVWAETNGDPVYGEDELRLCLAAEGMDESTIGGVIVGDLGVLA